MLASTQCRHRVIGMEDSGAGVVAMLIGPDAPIEVDIAAPRATHMEDAYDFYKPDLKSEYPAVDGHLSNTCYLRALDRCFGRMALKTEQRRGHAFDFRDYENAIFHQPYQKLVKKSYARYLWNQHKLGGDVDASLDQFLGLDEADTAKLELAALLGFQVVDGLADGAKELADAMKAGSPGGRKLTNTELRAVLQAVIDELGTSDDDDQGDEGQAQAEASDAGVRKRDRFGRFASKD